MRLTASWMLLLALAGCKHSASANLDGVPADAAPSGSAAGLPVPSAKTVGAEPVPGQYGRYFVDLNRFSAAYPISPSYRRLNVVLSAVEARAENGTAYAAICGALPLEGKTFDGAREKTVGDGKLLSEEHPQFYGTEAYLVRAQLKDGAQRLMKYIKYSGRFCSVGVEFVTPQEEPAALRFVDSFRPEPPPS